jgi:3-hydroxyacyl-CoA dehydrogenase
VAESPEAKGGVYETVCRCAAPEAVIASCSSSLDAEILAGLTPRPEQLLIAHPFQPVHMLPLVELVRSSRTAPAAMDRARAVLESLHRQVVTLQRSVPGLLVNRFAQALFRESIDLIEKGVASAEDIDRAIRYAVGMRYASIGLLEYYDAVGFELESTIAGNVYPDLCDARTIQPTVARGLRTGKTGQKAGQGLYDWSQKDAADCWAPQTIWRPASSTCWTTRCSKPAAAPEGSQADHRGPLGHVPGQNFIYTHLNRVIKKYDLDMIYLSGPGHGGNAMVGQDWLDGTYSEVYPNITRDEEGMQKLFKQFSFPGGMPSHVAPETPGLHPRGRRAGLFPGPRLRRRSTTPT